MRRRQSSIILIAALMIIIIVMAQNGSLDILLRNLLSTTPHFFDGTAQPLATGRPLVFSFSTAIPVFPTSPGNLPQAPTYPQAYAPANSGVQNPPQNNGQGGATTPVPVGVLTASGQCIVPNRWVAYTIQSGDTLAIIAGNYHLTADQLAAANCLGNPDLIYEGQVIAVPPQ